MLTPVLMPYLVAVIVASAAAAFCLLGIWAGWSQRPWFARAAALGCGLLLLLPIRGDELLALFSIALTPLALACWRLRIRHARFDRPQEPPGRVRFPLRDLFLATLLAAVAGATAALVRERDANIDWAHAAAAGGCLFAVAFPAAWLAVARRRRIVLALLLLAGAGGAWTASTFGLTRWETLQHAMITTTAQFKVLAALACGVLPLLIVVVVRLAQVATRTQSTRRRTAARAAVTTIALALLALNGFLYWHMLRTPDFPQDQYVEPNSFPEVMELARNIQNWNPNEVSLGTLATGGAKGEAVSQLRAIYQKMIQTADQPGFVSMDLERDASSQYLKEMLVDVQLLRGAARTCDSESRAAVAAGKPDEGADFSIANMQIGGMTARGGLQIHSLVGIAVEGVGRHQLHALHSDISAAKTRDILHQLLRLDGEREPIQVTAARDAAWQDLTFGWLARFEYALSKLFGVEYQPGDVSEAISGAVRRRDAMTRMLICELAVRLFEHDHQRLPQSLEELVPTYLPRVPVDSYSGRPLIYRLQDGKPLLYSVGGDGVDNGGNFGRYSQALFEEGFDFDLDTSNR